MKPILVAMSFALAVIPAHTGALAQQAGAEASIVVTGKYESEWEKGSKLEAEGLRDLEKAQARLAELNARMSAAQTERDGAQARAQSARSDFYRNAAEATKIADADRARDLGQTIEDAAEAWEKADDALRSADKDLEKATKRQRKGQKAHDKALAKVERGRAIMAKAVRLSRADS